MRKLIFDKYTDVTWKTREKYDDCISKIKRNRTEHGLKKIVGVEQ